MLDRARIHSGKVGMVKFEWHTLTKIECRLMTLSLLGLAAGDKCPTSLRVLDGTASGLTSVLIRQFDAASIEITASRLQFLFTNGTLSESAIKFAGITAAWSASEKTTHNSSAWLSNWKSTKSAPHAFRSSAWQSSVKHRSVPTTQPLLNSGKPSTTSSCSVKIQW